MNNDDKFIITEHPKRFTKDTLQFLCAWCHPDDHRPNVSHGICPKHKAQLLAELNTTTPKHHKS